MQLPVDGQVRIVPTNAALSRRGVIVSGFVEKLGEITQYHEAVSETFRNPKLAMVLGGQAYSDPFAEMRRAATDIDSNVKNFPNGYTNQFALGVFQLVMQTSQYTFLRA
ncbi:hypothetical protein D3C86_1718080 [compost metagenome]